VRADAIVKTINDVFIFEFKFNKTGSRDSEGDELCLEVKNIWREDFGNLLDF